MTTVKHLFLKNKNSLQMKEVESLTIGKGGIAGQAPRLPLRQILIVPQQTLSEFGLQPGDIFENVVVDGADLHHLESGTVIEIGQIRIRLTFHCEPCWKISKKVSPRKIMHRRGVLGSFLNSGSIKIGDSLVIREKSFESIPYELKDRIKWYLNKQTQPVAASKLVFDIGLSNAYCRAIPSIIRNIEGINKELIVFKSSSAGKTPGLETGQTSLFEFDNHS